ncbi:MAG: hypothetical protein KatS3mg077_0532 [Candidatus Binatia bacterium]|nr:MAG: hypothetical protein KatS3mg077_0532 [Candidatus Binatia bacterium]
MGAPTDVTGTARPHPASWLRRSWERWKQIAHAVGVVQTRFLMVAFYFVMVLPLGLVMRRREDRLRLRPPQGSLWLPHPDVEHNLERARKQY